jgi:hypothetical protein
MPPSVWGKFFPFFVTETELRCSEAMARQFRLFRVFDFARSPRVYVLYGSVRLGGMRARQRGRWGCWRGHSPGQPLTTATKRGTSGAVG